MLDFDRASWTQRTAHAAFSHLPNAVADSVMLWFMVRCVQAIAALLERLPGARACSHYLLKHSALDTPNTRQAKLIEHRTSVAWACGWRCVRIPAGGCCPDFGAFWAPIFARIHALCDVFCPVTVANICCAHRHRRRCGRGSSASCAPIDKASTGAQSVSSGHLHPKCQQ